MAASTLDSPLYICRNPCVIIPVWKSEIKFSTNLAARAQKLPNFLMVQIRLSLTINSSMSLKVRMVN